MDTPNNEILFWRIFRNIYLFNTIFSNFKLKKKKNYDRLYDPNYIYEHFKNSKKIIKDKVKSSKILFVFDQLGFSPNSFEIVAKIIRKDNQKNIDFYKKLFLVYSKSIPPNSQPKETIISIIFQNSNIPLLKAYLPNGSPLLYQNLLIYDYKSLKIVQYILSEEFLNSNNNNNRRIKENIKTQDINLYQDSFKLKHLLKIVSYLCEVYREEPIIQESQFYKAISISTYQFTNGQLKSSINKLLSPTTSLIINNNHNLNEIKNIIFNYIQLFYLFNTDSLQSFNYFLLFKGIDEIQKELQRDREGLFEKYKNILEMLKSTSSPDPKFFSDYINRIFDSLYIFKKEECSRQIFKSGNMYIIEAHIKAKSFNCGPLLLSSIASTQVLDYFFINYQDIFFADNNYNWMWISSVEVLEHYEKLMEKLSRKFKLGKLTEYYRDVADTFTLENLLRAINNKKYYNIAPDFSLQSFQNLVKKAIKENKQDLIISLISSFEFKKVEAYSLITNNDVYNEKIMAWIFSNSSSIQYHGPGRMVITFKSYDKKEFKIQGDLFFWFLACNTIGEYKEIFRLNQLFPSNTHLDQYFQSVSNYTPELIDLILNYYKENKLNFFTDPNITIPGGEDEVEYVSYSSFSFDFLFDEAITPKKDLPLLKHLINNHSYLFTDGEGAQEQLNNINPNNVNVREKLKKKFLNMVTWNRFETSQLLFQYLDITEDDLNQIKNTSYRPQCWLKDYYITNKK
ncbi:hypothetical protein DICPUDRAFT_99248 [Dictyostelium purpureum]|uniref:Uncharacterized protein n=1 Tax=Dictyostelium purpureum TaxID=5786 RepID=F0ZXM6_DICPU|nr:uncharacterized protein DICPUDRAFT_99248 [Dictyostelium purpureum]EGC31300.1 hypothetical protein DICPUDRAFT_99248 [Dictyostelium purpureum]|eukprot:XP_003292177.1 hypothetical protein DICPUDRAFT_99248 [Dictyostelium purpureum]